MLYQLLKYSGKNLFNVLSLGFPFSAEGFLGVIWGHLVKNLLIDFLNFYVNGTGRSDPQLAAQSDFHSLVC